jgi:hypothetical protein
LSIITGQARDHRLDDGKVKPSMLYPGVDARQPGHQRSTVRESTLDGLEINTRQPGYQCSKIRVSTLDGQGIDVQQPGHQRLTVRESTPDDLGIKGQQRGQESGVRFG